MKLAILLARDPQTYQDAHTALHVAESAVERGDDVTLFMLDEAVRLADARGESDIHVKLISLAERGLRPVLCQHNAQERGIGDRIASEVEVESVIENGRIAEECDRYLAFT